MESKKLRGNHFLFYFCFSISISLAIIVTVSKKSLIYHEIRLTLHLNIGELIQTNYNIIHLHKNTQQKHTLFFT